MFTTVKAARATARLKLIQHALDDDEWNEEVKQFKELVPSSVWEHFNNTFFCPRWHRRGRTRISLGF